MCRQLLTLALSAIPWQMKPKFVADLPDQIYYIPSKKLAITSAYIPDQTHWYLTATDPLSNYIGTSFNYILYYTWGDLVA